jgi:hypothetical protein
MTSLGLELGKPAANRLSYGTAYTQSVGLLGRGIRLSQGRYLHTEQHKQNKRTDIHASSGIRTHDPNVRAGEEVSTIPSV